MVIYIRVPAPMRVGMVVVSKAQLPLDDLSLMVG